MARCGAWGVRAQAAPDAQAAVRAVIDFEANRHPGGGRRSADQAAQMVVTVSARGT